jgi:hypothetical protein
MLDGYTEVMADALAPLSALPVDALQLRCTGVLGAAEAIAVEVNRGRTTVPDAVSALADLIVGSLATGR